MLLRIAAFLCRLLRGRHTLPTVAWASTSHELGSNDPFSIANKQQPIFEVLHTWLVKAKAMVATDIIIGREIGSLTLPRSAYSNPVAPFTAIGMRTIVDYDLN